MGEIMKSLLILFAVLMVAGTVWAADPPVKIEAQPASPAAGESPPRELSPMMAEINAAMETARLEVADLKLRYEAETDDKAAMEIMREVARVKRESRVEMMRIQLRHARKDGNEDLVLELEGIVAKMTAPPVKGVPVRRAAKHQ
jgi:hypothetical protein